MTWRTAERLAVRLIVLVLALAILAVERRLDVTRQEVVSLALKQCDS